MEGPKEAQPTANVPNYEYEMRGKKIARIYHFDEFYGSGDKKKNKRASDVWRLQSCLREMEFDVETLGSSTCMSSKELVENVKSVAQTTEETACVMLFIMTCEEHYGAMAYKGIFDFAEILEQFTESNCSSALKGIPKLIFIQKDLGALPITVFICGRRTGPIRRANEYPVTLDANMLVGYFERHKDSEPSMGSVLVQEIQKNKSRTINSILTSTIARKLWDTTPKFSSTLTNIFRMPVPPPPPPPDPTPIAPPTRVHEPARSRESADTPKVTGFSHSPQDRWGSYHRRPNVRRELELYLEAKRELVYRRRMLVEAGYDFMEDEDEDSDEDFYWGRDRMRDRGPRRDRDYNERILTRLMEFLPFGGSRRSNRDRDEYRRMEGWMREERRMREMMYGGGRSSRYNERRREDDDRILSKCAVDDSNSTSAAKDEKKEDSDMELEPLDESMEVEDQRNADIFMALACTEGHISYQSGKGSVFISSVCDALQKCSEGEDLLTIVSKAMGKVATDVEVEGDKQMPTYTSSLRKHVILDLQAAPVA